MDSAAAQLSQIPSGMITLNPPMNIDYSNIRTDFKVLLIQDIPKVHSVTRAYGNSACKYIEKIIEEKGDDIKNYFPDFLGGIVDIIFEKGLRKRDSDLYFIVGEFGHATYYDMNLKKGDAKKSHDLSKMRPESYLNTIFKGTKYKPHIIKEFTSAIIENLIADDESPDEKEETPLNTNGKFKEKYEEIFHGIDDIYKGISGGSLKDQMKVCSIDATKAIEKYAILALQSGTDVKAKIETLAYLYKDALNPVKPLESEILDGLFRPLKKKILLKKTDTVEANIQNLTESILENFLAADCLGPSAIKETYEKIVDERLKSQISLHPKGATKAIEISALKYVYEPGPDADENLKRIAYFYNNALYRQVHSTPAESEILKILFQQFKMDASA